MGHLRLTMLLTLAVFLAAPLHAASMYDYRIQGVNSGAAIKAPVIAATTANITLSGTQTIDGVAVTDHLSDSTGLPPDRVLVKNQSDQTANGVYNVSASGAWVRAPDFQSPFDVVHGTIVQVVGGSTQVGFWSLSTANPVTIATDTGGASNITFVLTSMPVTNMALSSADIFVGSVSNTAVGVPVSGDCTLTNAGSITCLDTNGSAFGTLATLNAAPAGTLTGTTIASNVVASSLTSLGTISSGTWNGTTIALAHGGTGQTTAANAFISFFESAATTLGDLVYGGSSGAPTRLSGNTSSTKQFLTETGSGSAASAPAWGALVTGDLPAPFTSGTISGNTSKFATATGALINGHCVSIDSNGNFIDAGGACTTGGGGGTVTSSTAGQLAYYASTGSVVVGDANLTIGAAALSIGLAGTNTGTLLLSGTTSGYTTLTGSTVGGGTWTLRDTTDNVLGAATTDTLTGKTFDTASSGNVLKINGTGIAAVTGTGSVVLAASPTLTGTVTGSTSTWSSAVAVGTTTTNGALNVNGTVTATTFSGSGTSLTGIAVANMGGFSGTPNSTTYARGDGSWSSIAASNYQTFTSSGTWTKPAGITTVYAQCWGGGGAGGGGLIVASESGGGGGGGGYTGFWYNASALGSTVTVTIGAGGTGVNRLTGNNGGNSSFGSLTAYGGAGGPGGATGGNGGGGGGTLGAGSGTSGGAGGGGSSASPNAIWPQGGGGGGIGGSNPGGNSFWGGAGGGGGQTPSGTSVGGNSVSGGAGGNGSNGVTGGAGSVPGGGGGGTASGGGTGTGGAGAGGECIVTSF